MSSTKTEGTPSPEDRRRKKALAIGLALVVILISGGIWGSSLSASGTPATTVDATQTGAAPPAPAATPTSQPKTTGPTSPAVASGSPPAPAPTADGMASAAKASSTVQLATVDQPVALPVPLDHIASIRDGITADVSGLESVQGQAQKAGEVAGPSLRFTVTFHNGTDHPLSTADVVVNVGAGPDDLPAITLSGPDVSAFPPTIAPGESGSASYVFLVPVKQRARVRILVNYQVDSPIAAFEGAAPTEGKP